MKITEHKLRHMYCNDRMTQKEIAEVIGVVQQTVSNWLELYNIESRTNSESHLNNLVKPSKKCLEEMYFIEKMSQIEIAMKMGVNQSTISVWMQSYNIKSRELSEAKLGKYTGENSNNWQGGISFEPYCNKFDNKFKEAVRKRDDFTCQLCGLEQNGKKLSVHHIHYDKANCYPDVVTLCNSCNTKVNSSRDYWEQFFEGQLLERGLYCWSISQET